MKTSILSNTRWLLLTILFIASISVNAQKTITWKGGTPGQPNEWYCPQNWSTSSVPDEFSDVVIPDVSTSSFSLPVIRSGKVEVNSLHVQHQGGLTIAKEAALIVNGYAFGILAENLKGDGAIVMLNNTSSTESRMIAKTGK